MNCRDVDMRYRNVRLGDDREYGTYSAIGMMLRLII